MSRELLNQAIREGRTVNGQTPMSTITESSARLNAALQGKIPADDRQRCQAALKNLTQEARQRNSRQQDTAMSLVMA